MQGRRDRLLLENSDGEVWRDCRGVSPYCHRSKDIEASGFNGTAAFMEVRVQSIVVEFILTHVDQLFGGATLSGQCHPPCHHTVRGVMSR